MGELIAVDPGENNGWAQFIDGELAAFGTVQWEVEFQDWLMEQTPSIWVVEDYIIKTHQHNHHFDKGITLQAIGAIKFHARRTGAVLCLQQPSLKPGAYAHMGATYNKGKRGMHYMDAIAHGHEYLLKHRMLKTRMQWNGTGPGPIA